MTIILSGASGSGKTTACALAARAAEAAGIPAGGIVCGAVFRNGVKTGIECSAVSSGPGARPWPLAEARPGHPGPRPAASSDGRGSPAFDDSDDFALRYGMWEFSKAALAAADAAACRDAASALGSSRGHIVFIDEIGPLELDRGVGLIGTLAALDEAALNEAALNEAALDGTRRRTFVVVARPDIAARLAARWPGARVVDMEGGTAEDVAKAIVSAHRADGNAG